MITREMADAAHVRDGEDNEAQGMKIPDRPNARDVLDELMKAARKVAKKHDTPSTV